jgi:MFS family permease
MFLWGTLLAPLPSSRLAAKLGPVRIFGTGILGAGALAVLVPFGAWFSTYHIAIRFIQGLFTVSTVSLRSTKVLITTAILEEILSVAVFKNRRIG